MWFPGFLFYCFPLYCSHFLLHHGEECPLQAGKYHKEEEEGDDDDKDERRKLMRVTNTLHMFTQICSLRHHCVNCYWDNLFSTRERERQSLILRSTSELLPLTFASTSLHQPRSLSLRSSLLKLTLKSFLSHSHPPKKKTISHQHIEIYVHKNLPDSRSWLSPRDAPRRKMIHFHCVFDSVSYSCPNASGSKAFLSST